MASSSNSSLDESFFILIVSLTLPFTWTAISISLSIVFSSSYVGHALSQIGVYPKLSFNSSVIWGAIGFNKSNNTIDVYLGHVVNNVILSCSYPVLLNSGTCSTLWSGIDKVYRIKSLEAQKQLSKLFKQI